MMFKVPEKYRTKVPKGYPLYSDESYGNNGAFVIPRKKGAGAFHCIASEGGLPNSIEWDHVSVTLILTNQDRCPTWGEMCFIKDLFWSKDETVLQYHPAEKDYVNHSPFCLHLWRPIGVDFPKPERILIGPQS